MALRVSFNNQMYKVPKLPTDLKAVTDVVSFLFGAELQQGWTLEYLDPKAGPIALTDEEAFKKLQKCMWASPKKPVKLNVRFTGNLEQDNARRQEERPVSVSTTLEERRETQATTNDATSTEATQSQQQISGDEEGEVSENEEQIVRESNDTEEDSVTVSRNKRKDKHRDLKEIRTTLHKTLDKTKSQGVQDQSGYAPMLSVALQLRKPKRNPGSSSGKSQFIGQNSKQIIRELNLQQKNIRNLIDEDEESEYEDDSYGDNNTNQKPKSQNYVYDPEIEEKVIRMYDIFPDNDLAELRRFVTPLHHLSIETLVERFLTS